MTIRRKVIPLYRGGPRLAAAIHQRASPHLRISLDLTRSRFFRHDRSWSNRTFEVQIQWVLARCAQASCAFGILGSEVAEWQAAGLRLETRPWFSTSDRA